MLSLDEQCKRDRGTNACFVSDLTQSASQNLTSLNDNLSLSYRKMHVSVLNCFALTVPPATVFLIVQQLRDLHVVMARYGNVDQFMTINNIYDS